MATVILFGGNPTAFLLLYFLTHFGRNIEDNTVPLGAINTVPVEHLGAFSAARLMILMGASAIGAPFFGHLFDRGHYVLVFGLGALLKFTMQVAGRKVWAKGLPRMPQFDILAS